MDGFLPPGQVGGDKCWAATVHTVWPIFYARNGEESMSDETNGTAENTAAEAATAEETTDWREKARLWEKRSKENHARLQELEPLAKKAQELEDAAKSDLEKLTEKFNEANARAAALEGEKNRLAVIAKHGIPEEFQDLVQGSDAESLSASAEKVRALIEKTNVQKPGYVVPAEGGAPALALNGDGIESALKNALGIV